MKIKYLQIIVQFLIVISFFFNTFNYHLGTIVIPITGFEALIKNEYFIIGNVFIWTILLGSLYHFIVQVFLFIKPKFKSKLDNSITAIVSIQLFFGLFIVTFLGRYLEILGIVVVGLIVLGAYIRYKFNY